MKYGLIFLFALAVASGLLYFFFQKDQDAARRRIEAGSHLVETPCGLIEYGDAGTGEPVLVLHGAGGGYDQGLFIGELMVEKGYRIIAPSRFGYLNTPIPADHSLEAQANTYACLLDALQIERVHVIAFSAGGPSGLAFASRYPERTLDLVMASAVSYTDPRSDEGRSDQESGINRVIGSDFVYWVFYRFFPGEFLNMVGIPKQVQKSASAEDQATTRKLLAYMQPMSRRFAGILLDQTRDLPQDRQIDIRVPTLVIHAKDDTLVTVSRGEYSTKKIPGAKLLLVDSGGHFLLGSFNQIRSTILNYWEAEVQDFGSY